MKKTTCLIFILIIGFSQIKSLAQSSLNEEMAFIHYIKLTDQNKKDFSAEYLFKFQNDIYDKYWNDEFDFNDKLNSTYLQIASKVKNFNSDVEYALTTTSEFGEYSFEQNMFEFTPFGLGTYFPMVNNPNSYYCQKCKTFTDINLFFKNGTDIQSLDINPDEASRIVKERKSSSGRVNRDVVIRVHFKLTSEYEAEVRGNQHDVKIFANITKVEVLDMYGYNQRSGSQRVIATILMDSLPEPQEVKEDIQSEEDPEITKLKTYIEGSFINEDLKKELIRTISAF